MQLISSDTVNYSDTADCLLSISAVAVESEEEEEEIGFKNIRGQPESAGMKRLVLKPSIKRPAEPDEGQTSDQKTSSEVEEAQDEVYLA